MGELFCSQQQIQKCPIRAKMIHIFFCFIERGFLQIELDGRRYVCPSPSFLCLNERQTLKTITSYNAFCRCVWFLPQFININMTLTHIRSTDYEGMCTMYDFLLLRPFMLEDFKHSFICGLTPDMAVRTHQLLELCGEQCSDQPDWYWSCRARSGFLDCLHLVERLYYQEKPDKGYTSFDCYIPEGMEDLANAIQIIWSSYADPQLTADAIVKMVHSNKAALNASFKEITGYTIYQYLLEYRLYAAIRKLRFTGLTIEEIACTTGFSSAANFSSIFKQKQGISPSEFRAQVVKKRKLDFMF